MMNMVAWLKFLTRRVNKEEKEMCTNFETKQWKKRLKMKVNQTIFNCAQKEIRERKKCFIDHFSLTITYVFDLCL